MKQFKRKKKWVRLIAGGSIIMLFLFVLRGLFHLVVVYTLPDRQSLTILDRHGVVLTDMSDAQRQTDYTSLDQLPALITSGLLRREDRSFFDHWGIAPKALARAFRSRLTTPGSQQGGSTIDQQIIKLSSQGFTRTRSQKLYELRRAPNLSFHYNKDDLLLRYINNLTFGQGVRGFSTACQIFFNHSCSQLSQGQLIYLLAKAKFPGRKKLAQYSLTVANQLGIQTYSLEDFEDIENSIGFYTTPLAPAYTQYVSDQLEQVRRSGSVFQSTLDIQLYRSVDAILLSYRPYLEGQLANDACVIVLQGVKIRTMNLLQTYGAGGSYINGCTRPRQVGSAIKPFFYLLAMYEQGRTAQTTIQDRPVEYLLDNGGIYAPKNFDLQYHGEVTLGQALGSSLNIPAVKVVEKIGLDRAYGWLRTIGSVVGMTEQWRDDPQHYGLALGLGVKEFSPLDFARMWTIFQQPAISDYRTFTTTYADTITQVGDILSRNDYRLLSFPQYNRFDMPNTYAKSGTSRNFVDGRVCGGRHDYTVCVRVGNYNAKPMRDSGYNTAGVIRHQVMMTLR